MPQQRNTAPGIEHEHTAVGVAADQQRGESGHVGQMADHDQVFVLVPQAFGQPVHIIIGIQAFAHLQGGVRQRLDLQYLRTLFRAGFATVHDPGRVNMWFQVPGKREQFRAPGVAQWPGSVTHLAYRIAVPNKIKIHVAVPCIITGRIRP